MADLQHMRQARGLTQASLAQAAGVHLRTIWRMEQPSGGVQFPNLLAVTRTLNEKAPLSLEELTFLSDRFGVPLDSLARSSGAASVASASTQASPADMDRLLAKVRVAVAEAGFSSIERLINDALLRSLSTSPPPSAEPTDPDRTLSVVSPPRPSPLGPGIVEQTYRHYSAAAPSAPPAAAPLPKPAAAPHPKRRPG